jgi:hypothetical protein
VGGGGSGGNAGGGGTGGCADTASDPLNCAECGRSCLGGECVNSVCQPLRLGDAGPGARYVDYANGEVFWSTGTGEG